ncbi:MAG: pantoate--beta-alanine ligase [Elusimicrobiota bacterium]
MKIIKSVHDMQKYSRSQKREGRSVGFVPTMGALHHGHLSLFDVARQNADTLVVSIFVNPTQFGPAEDYDQYPRDIERDRILCEERKCDALFLPSVEEMYPNGFVKDIKADPGLSAKLCGKSRPWHFDGVTTVVYRLFRAVEPNAAVFGKKDFQQALIIKKMVADYKMNVKILLGEIIRESDGLAMSSRNKYLNAEERTQALCLYNAINHAKEMFLKGQSNVGKIIEAVNGIINKAPLAKIDYVEIVDPKTLEHILEIKDQALLALAVFIGETRLIDNAVLVTKQSG